MDAILMRRADFPQNPETRVAPRPRRVIGARLRMLLERLAAASPDPPPEFFRHPFP